MLLISWFLIAQFKISSTLRELNKKRWIHLVFIINSYCPGWGHKVATILCHGGLFLATACASPHEIPGYLF